MIINDVELRDLDLLDLEDAELYEKAIYKMDDAEKKIKVDSLTDFIKTRCNLVFDFFNDIFGEGTDKKIFGNRTNYRECEKAFKDILDYITEQQKEIDSLKSKYSPNRAQRRSKK